MQRSITRDRRCSDRTFYLRSLFGHDPGGTCNAPNRPAQCSASHGLPHGILKHPNLAVLVRLHPERVPVGGNDRPAEPGAFRCVSRSKPQSEVANAAPRSGGRRTGGSLLPLVNWSGHDVILALPHREVQTLECVHPYPSFRELDGSRGKGLRWKHSFIR